MNSFHPALWGPTAGASARPIAPMRHSLLVAGDDAIAALCCSGPLAETYSVERATTLAAALTAIRTMNSGVLITELDLPDGDGVDVCRMAKTGSLPRTVLVTTDEVRRVPRALAAGCDSVLLKPFAPNLLFARLGRLTRALQLVARRPTWASAAGTNEQWPEVACVKCRNRGVTSFDATSLRRAWYACPRCEHVWIAKRQL